MNTWENSVSGKVNSHYKDLHANVPSILQERPEDHMDVTT